MKRLFALMLCLVMALSMIPVAAAEDTKNTEIKPEEIATIEPEAATPGPDDEFQETPLIIDSGSCGEGLTWMLFDNGLLQIDGDGEMTDYEGGTSPWYGYRSQIKRLKLDSAVRHIGSYAFYGCTKMAWSELAGHNHAYYVRSIGDCAFLSCYKLDYLDLGPNLRSVGRQAFGYCEGLKRVTVQSSPSLGIQAFGGCTGLEEISFVGDTPTFSSSTFYGCTATAWYPDRSEWTSSVLQDYGGSITWNKGFHGWCGDDVCWDFDALNHKLIISGSGETWDFDDFPSFYRLADKIYVINVEEGVTTLGERIFTYLEGVNTISMPDTLVSIRSLAFSCVTEMRKIVLPASVTSLGYYIFDRCNKLEEIHFLGHAPTSIDDNAFKGVTAAVYYYPLSSWAPVADKAYGGTLSWVCDDQIGDDVTWFLYAGGTLEISGSGRTWDFRDDYPGFYYLRDDCTSLDIESGVTGLGSYLFWSLEQLEYASFPETLTEIGQFAFSNCGLQEMEFTGDAPSFASFCFLNVTATATYLGNKSGWTADVLQDYGGSITWKNVAKPVITTQPKSQTAAPDTTVKFTVKATDATAYQWYYRTSSTGTWAKSTLTGCKTATLSVKATTARNGYQYKCKVSNAAGYVYTNAVTLTVASKPTITTQPKSQTASPDTTVKFTVKASGTGLTYQWYYRTSSTGTWKKSTLTGNASATLSVKATEARNGYQYKCRVSNAAGYVYTNAVTLTVASKPVITTQPADRTASAGATVKFTVKASGATSYQWYYRTSSTGEWKKSTGTGAATATLTVEAKSYRNGYQYKCKVSNANGGVYTRAATLTVT